MIFRTGMIHIATRKLKNTSILLNMFVHYVILVFPSQQNFKLSILVCLKRLVKIITGYHMLI